MGPFTCGGLLLLGILSVMGLGCKAEGKSIPPVPYFLPMFVNLPNVPAMGGSDAPGDRTLSHAYPEPVETVPSPLLDDDELRKLWWNEIAPIPSFQSTRTLQLRLPGRDMCFNGWAPDLNSPFWTPTTTTVPLKWTKLCIADCPTCIPYGTVLKVVDPPPDHSASSTLSLAQE